MLNDAHIQSYLQEQGLSPDLIVQVTDFRQQYEVDPAVAERVAVPTMPFYGKETLEMAIAIHYHRCQIETKASLSRYKDLVFTER